MDEPSPEDAVEILKGLRPRYEQHHKLSITDEAIEAAVKGMGILSTQDGN